MPVWFRSPRGVRIVGDLWTGGPSTVVLAHGFTGDRHEGGRFDVTAEALNRDGLTVLAFDFAGSGESEDVPLTVGGETDDLRAALRFLRERGAGKIGVLGLSLGALVAARARDEGVRTMVFWAPVTAPMPDPTIWYSREQLEERDRTGLITWGTDAGPRRHVVIDGSHLEERRSLDQRELLSSVRCPVLILHGSRDELVPLEGSRAAVPLLPKGSTLKVVRGAGHVVTRQLPTFIRHTRRWFGRHLHGS